MRLVITAGPPDIWVGLEPETARKRWPWRHAPPGGVDEQTRSGRHRAASGVDDALGFPLTLDDAADLA
jgi:hypothetical protein